MIKKLLTAALLFFTFLGGKSLAGPTDTEVINQVPSYETVSPIIQIVINLRLQKLFLLKDGQACLTTGISTGRKGHRTPTGSYDITQKAVHHISTIYDVAMPYFMRLGEEEFGIHYGYNPGHPASHGCIRVESMVKAKALFSQTPVGTRVEVK